MIETRRSVNARKEMNCIRSSRDTRLPRDSIAKTSICLSCARQDQLVVHVSFGIGSRVSYILVLGILKIRFPHHFLQAFLMKSSSTAQFTERTSQTRLKLFYGSSQKANITISLSIIKLAPPWLNLLREPRRHSFRHHPGHTICARML